MLNGSLTLLTGFLNLLLAIIPSSLATLGSLYFMHTFHMLLEPTQSDEPRITMGALEGLLTRVISLARHQILEGLELLWTVPALELWISMKSFMALSA